MKAAMIARAVEAGLLAELDEETIARWHRQAAAFREQIAAAKLSGAVIVVGVNPEGTGLVPVACVRGNVETIETACWTLLVTWLAQRKRQGLSATLVDLGGLIARAWHEFGGEDDLAGPG